jgi:hypothetical protein
LTVGGVTQLVGVFSFNGYERRDRGEGRKGRRRREKEIE